MGLISSQSAEQRPDSVAEYRMKHKSGKSFLTAKIQDRNLNNEKDAHLYTALMARRDESVSLQNRQNGNSDKSYVSACGSVSVNKPTTVPQQYMYLWRCGTQAQRSLFAEKLHLGGMLQKHRQCTHCTHY
jgi:hypothetical protein